MYIFPCMEEMFPSCADVYYDFCMAQHFLTLMGGLGFAAATLFFFPAFGSWVKVYYSQESHYPHKSI